MDYTKADHYEGIIRHHIRSGRASNKAEVVHQALSLLNAVTRNRGPVVSSFASAYELEALLLEASPTQPMTAARKARIYRDTKP